MQKNSVGSCFWLYFVWMSHNCKLSEVGGFPVSLHLEHLLSCAFCYMLCWFPIAASCIITFSFHSLHVLCCTLHCLFCPAYFHIFFLFSFLWNTAFQKYVFRFVNLSMLCWFSRFSSEVADSCIYLSSIEYLSRIFIWTNRFSLILAEITHPVKVLTVFQKDKKIYYSAGFYKSRTILPFSLTFSIRPENISTCVWVIFFKLNFKKAELFDERAMGFDANYFATFFVCCNYG